MAEQSGGSRHQELKDLVASWLSEDAQMGEVAAVTQGQIQRVQAAQRTFDANLGAGVPLRIQRRAEEARRTMVAYQEALKVVLGHILSYDVDGVRQALPALDAAYRTMTEAHARLQEAEAEAPQAGEEVAAGPAIGVTELCDLLEGHLRGAVPAEDVCLGVALVRSRFNEAHQALTASVAQYEPLPDAEALLSVMRDALCGYETVLMTLSSIEQGVDTRNVGLLSDCILRLVEAADALLKAKAGCEEAADEEFLDWQEEGTSPEARLAAA